MAERTLHDKIETVMSIAYRHPEFDGRKARWLLDPQTARELRWSAPPFHVGLEMDPGTARWLLHGMPLTNRYVQPELPSVYPHEEAIPTEEAVPVHGYRQVTIEMTKRNGRVVYIDDPDNPPEVR